MIEFVFLGIGVIFGIIIKTITSRIKTAGSLRVDNSDPTSSPYLFLELSESMNVLYKKKYVLFKVKIKDYIPQK